jgi:hypothetical protein
MSDLKLMIRSVYGTQARMAEQLGVSAMTVTNWVQRNPLPMLKHTKAISGTGRVTITEVVDVVLRHHYSLPERPLK